MCFSLLRRLAIVAEVLEGETKRTGHENVNGEGIIQPRSKECLKLRAFRTGAVRLSFGLNTRLFASIM